MRLVSIKLLTVMTFLLTPFLLHAAELSQGEKDTIFIGELKLQSSVAEQANNRGQLLELKRALQSLDSQLISSLNATRVFQLVERKRKGDLELEQGFAAAVVDPNDKSAAQAGKMAGAKFAFLPQIDGFEDNTERIEQTAIGRTVIDRKLFISAVVQVVDTTTGKLLPDSPSITVSKEETINARSGQAQTSDKLIVELAKEAAQKLSQELVALLRPAKILAVTGKQLTINRGTEAGFQNGETVEIFASRNIKDDDTGETFREEIPVGKATIVRSDKKQSTASISGENFGIAKGCVVKLLRTEAKNNMGNDDSTPGSSDNPAKW
ncbi:MAG: hypothetical protein JJE30_17615 [Desulfuromonadales bacterium]|nr:hypothetical protein [Desulfuromonadales bacterium]